MNTILIIVGAIVAVSGWVVAWYVRVEAERVRKNLEWYSQSARLTLNEVLRLGKNSSWEGIEVWVRYAVSTLRGEEK